MINVSGCCDLGPHCITNPLKCQDPRDTANTGTCPLDSVIGPVEKPVENYSELWKTIFPQVYSVAHSGVYLTVNVQSCEYSYENTVSYTY